MKKGTVLILLACAFFFPQVPCFSAEHGGKEHGGREKTGAGLMRREPSNSDIRAAMQKYVERKSAQTGAFEIYDPETGKTRRLKLERVHERVGKTGSYYYSCADFRDLHSAESLDLDLDVESKDSELSVVDVRIHKVGGKERYTYDKNDRRIPKK